MVRKATVAGEIEGVCTECRTVQCGGPEALQQALNGMEYTGLALMVRELNGRLGQLMDGDDPERVAWDVAQRFAGEPIAHYLLQALGRTRLDRIDPRLGATVPVSLTNTVPPFEVLAERFLGDAIARYQGRMAALGIHELL